MVSEYKALRSIFGPKEKEITGEWRDLQREELRNFLLFIRY
jgi:hypothetical protein